MTKLTTISLLFAMAMTSIMAAPARRDLITLRQPDGTTIQARMWGDEFMSLYTDAQTGQCMILDDDSRFWRPMTEAEVKTASSNWTESRRLAAMANNRYLLGGTPTKGEVHMPVLLVQFADLKFSEHYGSVAFFDSLFNMKNYDHIAFTNKGTAYHTSSVRNYFNTQSLGKFDFQADIIGPITVSKNYAYYGANSGSLKDVNFSQLYTEAIQLAMKEGYLNDAKKYDGDNDGNVDILYMVYAGWGENENGIADYIWAKNSSTSIKTTDNTYINNISASCELRSNGSTLTQDPDGIGVLVHEFSHALGLPDFYPVHSDGDGLYQRYGMDSWSVMDQGNYSGLGLIPNGYTTHERMRLGWISESDLDTVPTIGRIVLPPFGSSGKAMILRNPLNANEYITLENHYTHDNLWEQCWGNSSYFTGTTNNGLLITHVDYVQSLWNSNSVNDRSLHQYCNPLPADGNLWSYEGFYNEANALASKGDIDGARALNSQWKLDLRADIFPGYNNVTTLNGSNPKAKWYTGDTMAINITNIRQLEDGSLELTFGNYVEPEPVITAPDSLYVGLAWGPAGTHISQNLTITTQNLKDPVVAKMKEGSKFSVTADSIENSFVITLNESSAEQVTDTLILVSGKAEAKVVLKGIIVATVQDGKSKETTLTTDEAATISKAVFAHAYISSSVGELVSTIDSAYIYGVIDSVLTTTNHQCTFSLAGQEHPYLFRAVQTVVPADIDSIQVADTVIIRSCIGAEVFNSNYLGAVGYNGIIVSLQPYIAPLPPVGIENLNATPVPTQRKYMTKEKRIIINGHDLLGRKQTTK